METRLMHCISYPFGIVLSHGNVDYAAPETFYKVMLYENDEDWYQMSGYMKNLNIWIKQHSKK